MGNPVLKQMNHTNTHTERERERSTDISAANLFDDFCDCGIVNDGPAPSLLSAGHEELGLDKRTTTLNFLFFPLGCAFWGELMCWNYVCADSFFTTSKVPCSRSSSVVQTWSVVCCCVVVHIAWVRRVSSLHAFRLKLNKRRNTVRALLSHHRLPHFQ